MYYKSFLNDIERKRIIANLGLRKETKEAYGQYFTPTDIARFMASMFTGSFLDDIILLDPGAGIGILTASFVERLLLEAHSPNIDIHAFEIDSSMISNLKDTLEICRNEYSKSGQELTWTLFNSDFLLDPTVNHAVSLDLFCETSGKYTHCIMNPPYKKLSNSSRQRMLLSSAGIEAVNLYSAFVALAIQNMKEGGQLVAIIPRSFCNGLYYRPFRKFVLSRASIRQIHLFDSRTSTFKEDQVLQENVIIHLEVGSTQGDVFVSTSSDSTLDDLDTKIYPFEQIVIQRDTDKIIHIPTSHDIDLINQSIKLKNGIYHLGIDVSTGPIVDFRLKEYLINKPIDGAVPLLYPSHFSKKAINWPDMNGKKPNALMINESTKKWLYPTGYYTVVRRFSSKEEKRRIIPYVIHPEAFSKFNWIGIENHLNVFHINKGPLDKNIALGLAAYLSSLVIDKNFRRFSGHTQVNASDLKFLRYPTKDLLVNIGNWIEQNPDASQEDIDLLVEDCIK